MPNTTSKYTYAQFAAEVIGIVNDEVEITAEVAARVSAKARDLLTQQERKAQYNAEHKSERTPKGASEATKALATIIGGVLDATPKTAAEISVLVGNPALSALNVANACKYIPNCQSCKVVREMTNKKGLKAEKEYTAYFIG